MAVATAVVLPLVVDEKALAEALHKQNPSCPHASLSDYKACEFLARQVLDTGVVQSSTDFLRHIKKMPGVQAVILDALRDAWELGHTSGPDAENPFKEEEE